EPSRRELDTTRLAINFGCGEKDLEPCLAAHPTISRALLERRLVPEALAASSGLGILHESLLRLLTLPPATPADERLAQCLSARREDALARLERASREAPRGRWQRDACLPFLLHDKAYDQIPDRLVFC